MRRSTLAACCALGALLWALALNALAAAWTPAAGLSACAATCVEARLTPKTSQE